MRRLLAPKRIIRNALFLLLLSLVGCEPTVSASYYKYSIALTINGQALAFSQYIECSHVVSPTEGPGGPFHLRWQVTGDAPAAIRIDTHRVLFFYGSANCYNPSARSIDEPIEVLDTSEPTAKLYVVHNNSKYDSVSVDRVFVEPVETAPSVLGPTKEQRDLAVATLTQYARKFERVTVRINPYSVWATSDAARQYFADFKSVTLAKVGEAPPASGYPRDIVEFRFYRDRVYPQIDGRAVYPPLAMLGYGKDALEVTSQQGDNLEIYYAPDGPENTSDPTVEYKGVRFTVKRVQELYDPETKNILSFYGLTVTDLAQVLGLANGHSFL
jgi:hypothetical protein